MTTMKAFQFILIFTSINLISSQEEGYKIPRNIAVSSEISNFTFDCHVPNRFLVVSISSEDIIFTKFKKPYPDRYFVDNDTIYYMKEAKEYNNNKFVDCSNSDVDETFRAAHAMLSDYKCSSKKIVKEGEQTGLKMSIKFSHFSPSIICNEQFTADDSEPEYYNLNSNTDILIGQVSSEVTNVVDRSMHDKEIICRFDYYPDKQLLKDEASHLQSFPSTFSSIIKLDSKQPILFKSEFICKEKLNVEYLDDSVEIKIDKDKAICGYDARPKPTNITFIIKLSNGTQFVIESSSNKIDFKDYLEDPIRIACRISITFYDGTTKEKGTPFSEEIRTVEWTTQGEITESSPMLSTGSLVAGESNGGLNASAQIGIAVGVTMGILVILVVIIVIVCQRKEKEKKKEMSNDIRSEKISRDLKPQKEITDNSDRVVCADEDGSAVIVDTKANSRKPLYPLDNVNLSSGNDGITSSIYSEIKPNFYGYEEPASGVSVIYSNVDKTTPPPPYKIPYSLA